MHRSPPGAKGFLTTIGLLGAALLLATAVGIAGYWWLQTAFPRTIDSPYPGYWIFIFGVLAIIPMLVFLGRRVPYLTDWYYLLPATSFLLAFTFFPIVLTVNYSFTNYTGIRNGKPDRSTETAVTRIENNTLFVANISDLRCEKPDCAGEKLELTSQTARATVDIRKAEGTRIELTAAPPFTPTLVYRLNSYAFVGFDNYRRILADVGTILLPVFVWNVIFAAGTVLVSALVGLILGLLLNNKNLKLRGFYRTALIVSWAMPIVISFQVWGALLNVNFGAVNRLLGLLGAYPIPWTTDPEWAKVAVILIGVWQAFPYWMIATLSSLTTIPDDVYEAAKIDGASSWRTLTSITLPLLRPSFIPLLLSSFAFNFNNFGLIYLAIFPQPAVEGRPSTAQSVDILISWAFKTAFQSEGGQAYGLGGAIAVILFFITVFISLINFRLTGALKEVR
jgi:arabinogalactan oligomer / maltooligosaccharide transport system permease protein